MRNIKQNRIDLPFVVDNLKRAFRILCHSYATASENAVRSCIQNININCRELLSQIDYIVVKITDVSSFLEEKMNLLEADLLSSGISILKVNLSPMRTVSTSRDRLSRIRILGGGASGALVILIISGSLIGIMPNVIFFEDISYVHLTL